MASEEVKELNRKLDLVIGKLEFAPPENSVNRPSRDYGNEPTIRQAQDEFDEEALFQRFKARLLKEPAVLRLLTTTPELRVEVDRPVITVDGATFPGRVARLVANDFFKEARSHAEAKRELERTGPGVNNGSLSRELKNLVQKGFLTDEANGYQAVAGMKVNIVKRQAAAS